MNDKIGRYELISELGRGGMGIVFLAHDPLLDRPVVIKKILFQISSEYQDEEPLIRFRREAKALANLDHPAIIPIYDYGVTDGQPYLVMKYVSGGSLEDRLKKGTLSIPEINRVLQIIAPAIDYIHEKKIIHRDLKPANILFDENNNPYVADFGVMKNHSKSKESQDAASFDLRTATGAMMGTPAYMSPEQIQAKIELDGLTDIYSLGIIVYQMLTGALPYQADSWMGIAVMHLNTPIPNIRKARTDLPAAAQKLINRALAKKPHNRYQKAGDLALAFAELSQQAARPAQRSFLSKGILMSAGSMAGILALVGCLVVSYVLLTGVNARPTPTLTQTSAPATPSPQLSPSATRTLASTPTFTPTMTPASTSTPTQTPTNQPTLTNTPTPVTPTPTIAPLVTVTPSRLPATNTSVPAVVPTSTPIPPTPVPATNTPPPPTDAPLPTNTSAPLPTNTLAPPPTNTLAPPTNTLAPPPTNDLEGQFVGN